MENKEKNLPLLINIESTSSGENIDPEELENDTQSLREELSELDIIEKVDLVAKGKAPDGSKSGGEMVALGSMLATIATSAGSALIPSVANSIQSWLNHNQYKHKNKGQWHKRYNSLLGLGGHNKGIRTVHDNNGKSNQYSC
jgi:hypothetical protein